MKNIKHPEAIFIQLNTYCNATCINCPHVFTYKTIHEKGSMSEKTWQKILGDLIEMDYRGQVGFYLHHEPLIDVTLYEKINDINLKTNAYVVISTNGALLKKKNREKLIEAKPKTVHININSGIEEEYERSMGLNFKSTIENAQNFIHESAGSINIEINCPVMEGYDVKSLNQIFPNTKVNLDYYANSRGGLIPELFGKVKGSRFKIEEYCIQPSQNFNILFDGTIILCCIDWMHESKNDYGNINDSSIIELYRKTCEAEEDFKNGNYSIYKMCKICSKEMGFNDNSENLTKLNILITNHHLDGYTGSEIFTLTLAKSLKDRGHKVTVYSKFINEIGNEFRNYGINLIENLNEVKHINFDIAHIHHNISLIEVRNVFPHVPVVFLSQGILPFLEHPPFFDLNVARYIAISEEIKEELINSGILEKSIDIVGNLIDIKKFRNINEIKEIPKKALVISGRIDSDKELIIREACSKLNIEVEFIGGRFGVVNQDSLISKIDSADIIFSLGRGAIEGMIAGKCVIIFDYLGGDGTVNSDTFSEIKKNNFSGRRYKKDFNVQSLITEINKYDKTEIEKVRAQAIAEYSSESVTQKLERIYIDIVERTSENVALENNNLVKFINNVIQETLIYAYSKGERKNKDNKQFINNNETISDSERNKLIETSNQLIKEKNYFEAYRLVETNLRNNPSSKELNAFQNELFVRLSKRKLEKNWDVNKSVRALQNAEKYFVSGKLDDAKSKLMEVLNMEPQHIEAINNLSVWALTQNQNEYAIELIKYVLGFEKENEDALRNKKYMIENALWRVEEKDEYKDKIDQELNIYRNQLRVHELPNAHHIYTGKFLQNAVEELTGLRNFNSWCASEIDKLASKLGRRIYGISIGCGNGDTELEIMKQIKNKDLVHFTGLDINQTMVERGNKSLKESNIFNMEYKVGDFNYPKFEKKYDFFFANHSLHHVTELENLFSAIAENSNEDMIFLINDMIGRNGHVLWDGTKEAVQMIWNNLDEKYRYNAYSKEYDQEVMDHDCSSEGFEGIRAEDIVPLLNNYFDFDTYLPFSFIISRFIDRAYGHNYNVENSKDIEVINKIIDLEIKVTKENKFSATQAFIKLKNKNSVEKLKYLFQTPEETIKNRKNQNYFLEEDCKL
ncbi:MAG: methyltransferase domain-containing protein [Melioribacteraceae bacterium]